MKADIATTI